MIKVFPRSEKKAELQSKDEDTNDSVKKSEKPGEDDRKTNVNEMGIQMISRNIFEQIFRNVQPSAIDREVIER